MIKSIAKEICESGNVIGNSLKSVKDGLKEICVKQLEFKVYALKYTNHSKKKSKLINRICELEDFIKS